MTPITEGQYGVYCTIPPRPPGESTEEKGSVKHSSCQSQPYTGSRVNSPRPRGMKMALVVLAISALREYSDAAYTVDYYDCNVPTQISTYQHTEICKHYTNHSSQPTTYTLLQRRLVDKLSGYSCKITRSTWTQYCGAYSHAKMARPPEIEIPEPGSTLQ